jgi:NAD(P)-dependent dehydrogenase (short-subunit alcohol dehydrogenase family)
MAVNVNGPQDARRQGPAGDAGAPLGRDPQRGLGRAVPSGGAGIAYTTSKHARIGITRSIAWTYRADSIRCNAICPGGVDTNIGMTAAPTASGGL